MSLHADSVSPRGRRTDRYPFYVVHSVAWPPEVTIWVGYRVVRFDDVQIKIID